jgi:hypothetical protein
MFSVENIEQDSSGTKASVAVFSAMYTMFDNTSNINFINTKLYFFTKNNIGLISKSA